MSIKKALFFVLVFLPVWGLGKNVKKKPYVRYYHSDGHFYYHLDLFVDSTFIYKHGFKLGDMKCNGKWRIVGDTLKLLNQQMPWTVLQVEEQKMDTVNDKIIVKVITSGPDSLINGFAVWINNKCEPYAFTNKYGIVEFHTASATRIYFDDREVEEYVIKSSSCNYFVVTMSMYPIYGVSPRWVTWKEWIIDKHSIKPIECGKILRYIVLKRT